MHRTWKRKIAAVAMVLTLFASLPFGKGLAVEAWGKSTASLQLQIGKLEVTKKTYRMTLGTQKKLKGKTSQKIKTIQYSSNKKDVISVGKKGVLRAKGIGTAKITVTVKTKSGTKKAWMKVQVNVIAPVAPGYDSEGTDYPIIEETTGKNDSATDGTNTPSTDGTNNIATPAPAPPAPAPSPVTPPEGQTDTEGKIESTVGDIDFCATPGGPLG